MTALETADPSADDGERRARGAARRAPVSTRRAPRWRSGSERSGSAINSSPCSATSCAIRWARCETPSKLAAQRDAASLPRTRAPARDHRSADRHLTQLVDDLLDVARVTSGKIVAQAVARRSRGTGARNLVDEAGRSSRERRLQIEPRCAGLIRSWSWVIGSDWNRSSTTSSPTPSSTPRPAVASTWWSADGDPAILRVVDTGVGISAEVLPTIFEPFTQASQTLDRAQGGMGLGLSVVRALVRLHGGEVVRLERRRRVAAPSSRFAFPACSTPRG